MQQREMIRISGIFVFILSVTLLHYFTPPSAFKWHYLYQRLFYLPVAYAALYYGWRGGLLAALLAGVNYLPQIVLFQGVPSSYGSIQYLDILLLCSMGILVGVLADRERNRQKLYQKVLQELSNAHKELQDHFEGMKRAERLFALGQLSAGLAHEIRNPLASISGAVGILQRNVASEQKKAECLTIIDKESHRLNRLLTRFLDFARPRPPHFQEVRIDAIFDAVIILATHAIGQKPIRLRKEISSNIPNLACDSEQLEQVLLNLTINAIQASTAGGEVVLSARTQKDHVLIEVKDQGSGVNVDDIDKLFDPFFTTKEEGTGLGLPVAHEIIRQFGGTLSAQRNKEKGMTFVVSLPLTAKVSYENTAHPSGR